LRISCGHSANSIGDPPIGVDIRIVDGQLEARAVRNSTGYVVVPRLYLFTAATQTTREIPIPFDLGTIEHGDALPIPELSGFRIDTSMRSPDSWNYQGPNYRGGAGLFTGLFGGGPALDEPRLEKEGAIVRMQLPNEAPYYRHNLRFLGWIVE